jgi:mRNA-degrading endonuclease toxin of MazEF toxin-antitoxin module
MKRGEVWEADLPPPARRRPVLILLLYRVCTLSDARMDEVAKAIRHALALP